jgi:preprotein translocase subunit SecA
MDDSLMRVFGGARVQSLMGTFGIPADQPIEMKMISKTLESAQTKIEGFHFDSRKQILAYDDVLNQHRQTVYARRRKLLTGDESEVATVLAELETAYEGVRPVIAQKKAELGDVVFLDLFRRLSLQMIDMLWVEHLEVMGYTRSSVGLRAYGQRDPLIEYRKEGTKLFKEMEAAVLYRISEILPNLKPQVVVQEETVRKEEAEKAQAAAGTTAESRAKKSTPIVKVVDFNRNDLVTLTNGEETKELKYKRAEELLESGWTIVNKK